MITIVDYGVGHLASVQNMLKKCDLASQVTNDHAILRKADKIILPGVGAFNPAMQKLKETGLDKTVHECAQRGTPILGICLGAQLLLDRSEEGELPGLSLIEGTCRRFDSSMIAPLRTPHMGWSDVNFAVPGHPLALFNEQPRFYFTHSYYLNPAHPEQKLASSFYGHEFTCAVFNKNIMGVQFHPEKSHKFGAQMLRNFASMEI
jgi:imidazole glycerol-phosphate synthase subunit HisH